LVEKSRKVSRISNVIFSYIEYLEISSSISCILLATFYKKIALIGYVYKI